MFFSKANLAIDSIFPISSCSQLQAGEGRVSASHFLYTHLQFIRHTITMARNSELLATMKAQLDGKAKVEEGKKIVKAQDVVRMYENMIQNLLEVPTLPGLEEDEDLAANTKAKVMSRSSMFFVHRTYFDICSRLLHTKPSVPTILPKPSSQARSGVKPWQCSSAPSSTPLRYRIHVYSSHLIHSFFIRPRRPQPRRRV